MEKLFAVLVALAMVLSISSANAQWRGFYGGLQAGYASGAFDEAPNFGRPEAKPNGALLGGQLGYNGQFGKLVLGVEADLRANNASGSRSAQTCEGCIGYSNVETTTTKIGMSGSTTVHAGYAFDRFMPYVMGGVAFASVKTTTGNVYVDSVNRVSGAYSNSVERGTIGSVFGGGLKYAVTRNLSIGAEYRRENFSLEKNGGSSSGTRDMVSNVGLFKVDYRF